MRILLALPIVALAGAWRQGCSRWSRSGEGIVLLRNRFILGCDDQYFYEGSYVLDDGAFRALVKVSHYAGDRAVSIFRDSGPFATLESFHAELRGAQDSNGTLQLSGGITGEPDRRLAVAVALSRIVPNLVRQT